MIADAVVVCVHIATACARIGAFFFSSGAVVPGEGGSDDSKQGRSHEKDSDKPSQEDVGGTS